MKEEITEEAQSKEHGIISIIDIQLITITTLMEIDDSVYDAIQEEKIRTMSLAFRIINKMQRKLLE